MAVTLRYLAGGQILDLLLIYHISKSECYRTIRTTIDAINGCPELKFSFPFDDKEKLRKLEWEFAQAHFNRYGSYSWRGQVGAIDGIDISQRNPGKAVDNPTRYYVSRKGGHMLLVIAICDAHRRFLHYDISQAATTHDSLAWSASKLGVRFQNGELRSPFFLAGDNAFTCTNSMVTPMNDTDFDFYQSSNRMAIECAFGIFVRRWGVFWRPLEVKFRNRAALVGAAMRLHNFCIDRRITLELKQVNGATEVQPRVWLPTPTSDENGAPLDFLDTFDHSASPHVPQCETRDRLREHLLQQGLRRPGESARTSALRAAAARAAAARAALPVVPL